MTYSVRKEVLTALLSVILFLLCFSTLQAQQLPTITEGLTSKFLTTLPADGLFTKEWNRVHPTPTDEAEQFRLNVQYEADHTAQLKKFGWQGIDDYNLATGRLAKGTNPLLMEKMAADAPASDKANMDAQVAQMFRDGKYTAEEQRVLRKNRDLLYQAFKKEGWVNAMGGLELVMPPAAESSGQAKKGNTEMPTKMPPGMPKLPRFPMTPPSNSEDSGDR
jgi:hypothetical protein